MDSTAAARKFSEWKKASAQPLRVYRNSSDTAGTVLCPPHRDSFLALHPAAFGCGEYGGDCEQCARKTA